ncbi:MAG: phosphoglycerate kinase, partial [Bdellovibrionales bacterium]|nr:phosphoglycerate kinase [Bdellovibrionales bacterium]
VKLAKGILMDTTARKISLPTDHLVATSIHGDAVSITEKNIPDDMMGLDIGEVTVANYVNLISKAKTVLWNGPMGLFEKPCFAHGSMEIAKAMAHASDAFTLVGGGDSVSAVKRSGKGDLISHISTGGGASLEYIEDGELPGIQALKFGINE